MARTKAERAAAAASFSRRGPAQKVSLGSLDTGVLGVCILPFLRVADILAVSATCHYMHDAASQDILWRAVIQRAGVFDVDDPSGPFFGKPLKDRLRRVVLQKRAKKYAAVKKQVLRNQQRRGVHSLIDNVRLLGLQMQVWLNGHHCKLAALPRGTGVKMRRGKEVGRASSHITPGRFGGKAAARGQQHVRMFPQSMMLKAIKPASMDILRIRDCTSLRVTAASSKLGQQRDILNLTNWQLKKPSTTQTAWKTPLIHSEDRSLKLHQFTDHEEAEAKADSHFTIVDRSTGASVLVASWEDGHMQFILITIPFATIVRRMTTPPGFVHKRIIDDVDKLYGLHDYSVNICLRSLGKICWEGTFVKQDAERQDADEYKLGHVRKATHSAASRQHRAVLWLLRPDGVADGGGRQLYAAPVMHWTTDAMAGVLERSVVMDVTVWDEHLQPMWAESRVLPLRYNAESGAQFSTEVDMSAPASNQAQLVLEGPQGRVCCELAEMDAEFGQANLADRDFGSRGQASSQYSGKPIVVRTLWVELQNGFINEWFGTEHEV